MYTALARTSHYRLEDNVFLLSFPSVASRVWLLSIPFGLSSVMASNSFQGRVWWARPKLDHKAFTLVSLEGPARMTATWGDSTRPYQPASPRLDPSFSCSLFSSHRSLFSFPPCFSHSVFFSDNFWTEKNDKNLQRTKKIKMHILSQQILVKGPTR